MIIKYYIWSCEMRKQKPILETCKKYVKYQSLCIAKGLQISGAHNFLSKITEKSKHNEPDVWEDIELRPAPPAPLLPPEKSCVNFENGTTLKLKKIRQKNIQKLVSQLTE